MQITYSTSNNNVFLSKSHLPNQRNKITLLDNEYVYFVHVQYEAMGGGPYTTAGNRAFELFLIQPIRDLLLLA